MTNNFLFMTIWSEHTLVLMYTGGLFGLRYVLWIPVARSRCTFKKFTDFKLISTVIRSPNFLNSLMICFLFLFALHPEHFLRTASPSSRYNPTLSAPRLDSSSFRMNKPTSSHISAPSKTPIVTSKALEQLFFIHGLSLLSKRRVFLACMIVSCST